MPSSNAFREIDDTGQGDPKPHKCLFLRKKYLKMEITLAEASQNTQERVTWKRMSCLVLYLLKHIYTG